MAEQYGLGDPLFDPQEAKIDIVFIHGLGGNRTSTWTWEGDGRKLFWPKDLLPQDCPTARILSFGYNAEFAHFFPFYGPKFMPEKSTIDNHSTALLRSLTGLRDKTKTANRPVIFVCHSLGGLVCANALSRYHGADLASAGLVEKTAGVVFLGTPFEGTSKAKWAGRALKVLDWVSTTHKEDVKDLEERSANLTNINDTFQKFLKARDRSETGQFVEVACFFEQYAMYKAGKKIGIIVPKESACLPGIDPQSIQANHVDMCKFEDDDREGYKNISQRLSQWISDLDGPLKGSTAKTQTHSVYMGDVNYRDKIENNQGVVMGHAYSTATDGVRIIGSTHNTYNGVNPNNL
ncbi:putative ribonuclease p/mrp subunit [Lindgomyces ingoldianus]|uniref:Ribonuclease p/mrp subunit n=1 Tax=Lindgomyces ingoldianus TaxID=673940 RepID=A0ACB6RCZ0_9PLEO|nr:putative ribonuclease p/mrp subunit [Lindgomyces ingoldianus]KAF2476197.1 putative ribonuclease p/mrp subunit [Lindgomyces ingoldianus]